MKLLYQQPMLKVIKFEVADVITTSTDPVVGDKTWGEVTFG